MSALDRIQDLYPDTLGLYILEHLNIYNKKIVWIYGNDRYDLTSSKWNDFYQ